MGKLTKCLRSLVNTSIHVHKHVTEISMETSNNKTTTMIHHQITHMLTVLCDQAMWESKSCCQSYCPELLRITSAMEKKIVVAPVATTRSTSAPGHCEMKYKFQTQLTHRTDITMQKKVLTLIWHKLIYYFTLTCKRETHWRSHTASIHPHPYPGKGQRIPRISLWGNRKMPAFCFLPFFSLSIPSLVPHFFFLS